MVCLSKNGSMDLNKVTFGVNIENHGLTVLCILYHQGERILKVSEQCRKKETEEEKVLPFYASSLTQEEEEDVSAAVAEPPSEQLAEVSLPASILLLHSLIYLSILFSLPLLSPFSGLHPVKNWGVWLLATVHAKSLWLLIVSPPPPHPTLGKEMDLRDRFRIKNTRWLSW